MQWCEPKLTGRNNKPKSNDKHKKTMDEKPKYNWSYAVAFFLFDYPMLIVADWITDGWHNIHWGATAIEAAIVSVVLTLVLHLMQKLKRKDKNSN